MFGDFDFKVGLKDSQEFEKFPRHSRRKKQPPPVQYHFLRSSAYQGDEEGEEDFRMGRGGNESIQCSIDVLLWTTKNIQTSPFV